MQPTLDEWSYEIYISKPSPDCFVDETLTSSIIRIELMKFQKFVSAFICHFFFLFFGGHQSQEDTGSRGESAWRNGKFGPMCWMTLQNVSCTWRSHPQCAGNFAIKNLDLRSFGQLVAMADSEEVKYTNDNGKSESDKSDTIKDNPEVVNSKLNVAQVSNNNPVPLDSKDKDPIVSGKQAEELNMLIFDFLTAKLGCSHEASLGSISDGTKTRLRADLVKDIRDLQEKVKEQKEWAQKKVRDSSARLSKDFSELQTLRMAKVEKEKMENKKRHPEKSLTLQLTEEYLQHLKGQASTINNAIRRLEMQNAQIRADTQAFKLSESETQRGLQEVLKRNKKHMKKVADVEKQINILGSQYEKEKLRAMQLEQELLQAEKEAEEAEMKWRQQIKEKESMFALVAEESRKMEAQKASSRAKLSKLRQKVETDGQVAEDECRRLEDELSRLRMSCPIEELLPESLSFLYNYDEATSSEKTFNYWICMICMESEVSVVLLPCTHQVLCFSCFERNCRDVGARCLCCHVEIEDSIKVYGPSS